MSKNSEAVAEAPTWLGTLIDNYTINKHKP